MSTTSHHPKLADSDRGARELEWLLDRIEGEDRPTRGNGTYKPNKDEEAAQRPKESRS